MKLQEEDLVIDVTDAITGLVFDQMKPHLPNYHGLSQMHRVDFMVEVKDALIFVEIKDPGHPKARPEGLAKFLKELEDGTLCKTFACKFMDSFVYRWAEGEIEKPIHYISLVTLLDTVSVLELSEEIAKQLPPLGRPVVRWQRAFLESCQVFNFETWNEEFPKWPVQRVSSTALRTGTLTPAQEG